MKEFKRQWEYGMLSGSPNSFDSGASAKEAARFNWRAALEWLQNMVIHESDGPSNPKDLMDCINEELENE